MQPTCCTTKGLVGLAQHYRPLQPPNLEVLTAREGSSPPYGSRLLPCASLFWLVPGVLLEWAQQQPAGPCTEYFYGSFSELMYKGLVHVHRHWQAWHHAFSMLVDAAQQTPDAFAAIGILDATERALSLRDYCQVPAAHLVQLLHLASNVAARVMPHPAALGNKGPLPQGSSSSCHGRASCRGTTSTIGGDAGSSSSGAVSSSRGDRGGSGSGSGTHGDSLLESGVQLESLIGNGSTVALPVLGMSVFELWSIVGDRLALLSGALTHWGRDPSSNSSSRAATSNPSSTLDAVSSDNIGGPEEVQPSQESCHADMDAKLQADLTAICAAWQQTLPQLTSLTDAALRTGRGFILGSGAVYDPSELESHIMLLLLSPGLFMAAGLQPGSPALKPLSGLAFTVTKLASSILANPESDVIAAHNASVCLSEVLGFSSLVLQAACASSSGACPAGADAVITMLVQSKVPNADAWHRQDAVQLSCLISGSTCTTSNSSSNRDGVAMVPWLVSLGRCCLGYAGVQAMYVQQSQGRADMLWQTVAPEWHGTLETMRQALQEVAAVLPAWLQDGSISAQFTAAGYRTERVLELLQEVAQRAGQHATLAGAAAVSVPHELLRDLGLALSSLPMRGACNNPRCSLLAGLSEQELAVGSGRMCGGCRLARYCCKACQAAHWKQHKPACKAVASARAATDDQSAA